MRSDDTCTFGPSGTRMCVVGATLSGGANPFCCTRFSAYLMRFLSFLYTAGTVCDSCFSETLSGSPVDRPQRLYTAVERAGAARPDHQRAIAAALCVALPLAAAAQGCDTAVRHSHAADTAVGVAAMRVLLQGSVRSTRTQARGLKNARFDIGVTLRHAILCGNQDVRKNGEGNAQIHKTRAQCGRITRVQTRASPPINMSNSRPAD